MNELLSPKNDKNLNFVMNEYSKLWELIFHLDKYFHDF